MSDCIYLIEIIFVHFCSHILDIFSYIWPWKLSKHLSTYSVPLRSRLYTFSAVLVLTQQLVSFFFPIKTVNGIFLTFKKKFIHVIYFIKVLRSLFLCWSLVLVSVQWNITETLFCWLCHIHWHSTVVIFLFLSQGGLWYSSVFIPRKFSHTAVQVVLFYY